MKSVILTVFTPAAPGRKSIHHVPQPSLPSKSRTLPSSRSEALSPGTNHSPSPPPPSTCQSPFYSLSRRSGTTRYLSFGGWLVSPNTMPSRLIRVVTCVRISFLFKAESRSTVCICHIFIYSFIHQRTPG